MNNALFLITGIAIGIYIGVSGLLLWGFIAGAKETN